jgi:hypothetical protein
VRLDHLLSRVSEHTLWGSRSKYAHTVNLGAGSQDEFPVTSQLLRKTRACSSVG